MTLKLREPPLAFYFLLAWAMFAVFLTAATLIWVEIQMPALAMSVQDYGDLFVDMALRALGGVVLYALYYVAIRGTLSGWKPSRRVVLNWIAFLVLTSAAFVGYLLLIEQSSMANLTIDLVPILFSSSLAMLLGRDIRRVLFALEPATG